MVVLKFVFGVVAFAVLVTLAAIVVALVSAPLAYEAGGHLPVRRVHDRDAPR